MRGEHFCQMFLGLHLFHALRLFRTIEYILSTYHQDLWAISANANNYFRLFATHFFTNFRFLYEMMPQGSNGSRLMKASRHRATLVQGEGMLLHTFCKVAIYKHYRTHQKTFQLASSPRPKSIH